MRKTLLLMAASLCTTAFCAEPTGGCLAKERTCDEVCAVPGEAVSRVPEFILLTTECKPYREKRMTAQPDEELRKTLDAAVEAGDDFVVDFVRVYDMEP